MSDNWQDKERKWTEEKRSLIKQNSDLRAQLTETQKNIEKLEKERGSRQYSEEKLRKENEEFKKREKIASTVSLTQTKKFPYRSLCQVFKENDGKVCLHRLSDVDGNNILDALDKDYPQTNKLYEKSGDPQSDDYIGIWDWNVTPNLKDASRKYYDCHYNRNCSPLEIVFLKDCESTDAIIQSLKAGIEGKLLCERIMFAHHDQEKGKFAGIVCRGKDLMFSGNRIKIKDAVVRLPHYCFPDFHVCCYENRSILNLLDIGIPDRVVYVKDKMEIVKEKILSRASWSAMKQRGITKNERKIIRDFLNNISVEELSEEIAQELDCDLEEAQEALSAFTKRIHEYLNGKNIENALLEQVVRTDSDLLEECKSLISEDWKKENAERIAEAKSNLNDWNRQISDAEEKLQKLDQNYILQEERYDQILSEITRQEKLAADVENKVKEKIEEAQKNAAEFIASQAFMPAASYDRMIVKEEKKDLWEKGMELPEDGLEILDNWQSAVDLISYELQEAGVLPKYSFDLAAYLYAAYVSKASVLLMGPNGRAIADAFSAAVSGKTAAILQCVGEYDAEVFQEIKEISEPVLVIENIFAPQWHNQIIDYTQNSSKFVIAITPYAEDMRIEPQGILNYWLPLMTELFVDSKPTCNYGGGRFSKNYTEFQTGNSFRKEKGFLPALQLGPLAKAQLETILSYVRKMVQDSDYAVLETLFYWIPYSYILDKMDDLNEFLVEKALYEKMPDSVKKYIGDPA